MTIIEAAKLWFLKCWQWYQRTEEPVVSTSCIWVTRSDSGRPHTCTCWSCWLRLWPQHYCSCWHTESNTVTRGTVSIFIAVLWSFKVVYWVVKRTKCEQDKVLLTPRKGIDGILISLFHNVCGACPVWPSEPRNVSAFWLLPTCWVQEDDDGWDCCQVSTDTKNGVSWSISKLKTTFGCQQAPFSD